MYFSLSILLFYYFLFILILFIYLSMCSVFSNSSQVHNGGINDDISQRDIT